MLKFIQKNFIKINLNKNDFNEDGSGYYVYWQRKRTGIVKGILRISIVNNIVDNSSADRYINK